jgi:plasmid maintenance system antidote protein VapI
MFGTAKYVKGIHPGLYLERELKKRGIPKGRFSLNIQEYPQTLVAITKGKRRMNPGLALRVEKELGMEDGLMMTLQVLFDMSEEKRKQPASLMPDLSKFRPTLFWDADMSKLNWELHQRYIIRRVMLRGNKIEQQEILSLYGTETIKSIHPMN